MKKTLLLIIISLPALPISAQWWTVAPHFFENHMAPIVPFDSTVTDMTDSMGAFNNDVTDFVRFESNGILDTFYQKDNIGGREIFANEILAPLQREFEIFTNKSGNREVLRYLRYGVDFSNQIIYQKDSVRLPNGSYSFTEQYYAYKPSGATDSIIVDFSQGNPVAPSPSYYMKWHYNSQNRLDSISFQWNALSHYEKKDLYSYVYDGQLLDKILVYSIVPHINRPRRILQEEYRIRRNSQGFANELRKYDYDINGNKLFEWRMKYLTTATFSVEEKQKKLINIFPNPVEDKLMLRNVPKEVQTLSLVDLRGNEVLREENGAKYIDLSGLAPGFYVLHLFGPNVNQSIQVVKKGLGF